MIPITIPPCLTSVPIISSIILLSANYLTEQIPGDNLLTHCLAGTAKNRIHFTIAGNRFVSWLDYL
ncbi:MAG: hypothetical protein WB502_11645 [Thermoactinomyces sp.]